MTPPKRYGKLVAFGDSITHGHHADKEVIWTTRLQAQLKKTCGSTAPQVINAGVGGNTSAEGLERIEQDVLVHQPALVLVEFGGNDTSQLKNKYVPLANYVENLKLIHQKITGQGGQVIFVSFPPLVNDWHGQGKSPFFKDAGGMDEFIQLYRDATKAVAAELHCQFFDLDQLMRQAIRQHATLEQGQSLYIEPDGVHLTPLAHQLVADVLTEFLTPSFTHANPA